MDAFLRFLSVFSKTAHLCEFLPFSPVFGTLRKISSEDFSYILLKCARKILLKDSTVVSPGKIWYFWDFGWSYIQKFTSTTQIFHLGITFEISISYGPPPHFLVLFWYFFKKKNAFLEFLSMWRQKNLRRTKNWRQNWRIFFQNV